MIVGCIKSIIIRYIFIELMFEILNTYFCIPHFHQNQIPGLLQEHKKFAKSSQSHRHSDRKIHFLEFLFRYFIKEVNDLGPFNI